MCRIMIKFFGYDFGRISGKQKKAYCGRYIRVRLW